MHLGAWGKDTGGERLGRPPAAPVPPKTARTSSGRPMPMLSVTRASKKPLARRGSSKTRVRETSTWRMESSQKYPAALSSAVNGVGTTAAQRSKKPWTSAGPKRSQMAWRRAGWAQEAKPLASSPKTRPSRRAWRLAHSWPFSHYMSARIMSRGTGGAVPASDV